MSFYTYIYVILFLQKMRSKLMSAEEAGLLHYLQTAITAVYVHE